MGLRQIISMSLAAGSGILLLSFTGVLRSLDAGFFDHMVVLAPSGQESSGEVLVIESEHELEFAEVVDLAEKLDRLGARLSVFDLGSAVEVDAVAEAKLHGLHAVVSADPSYQSVFGGSIARPPPADGIWRGALPRSGEGATSPESPVVGQLGLAPLPAANLLDFKVPRNGLQRIDATRARAGDLPRSLVDGKVVLVGTTSRSGALITTPAHRGSEALEPLLFQAVVVDAELRGGIVRIVPATLLWGIALMLVGALGFIALRWNFEHVLWIASGGTLLAIATAWVALWGFHWWLPPTRAAVLLGTSGALASGYRASTQRRALRRTLRHLAVEVQDRAENGGFFTAASPWPMIEAMLAQSFARSPGFVLRADENSGVLEAATASGAEACVRVLAGAALRLDQEPFATALRDKAARLADDLVVLPIRSAARVFGFWVFKASETGSAEQAGAYAERLAAMLEARHDWRARARPHQLEEGAVGPLSIRPLHDQLEGSFDLLDRGRQVLAEALDASGEAILLFDPFGRLVHSSRPSADLLGVAGVNYLESAPAELLGGLTTAAPDEIRRALRFVTLKREEVTFKGAISGLSGREFFIRLRALDRGAGAVGDDSRAELPGVMVMIEDVTQSARLALLKDEFVERVHFQLRNDFEAILAASALLEDPRIDAADREEIIAVIGEKVEEVNARMTETGGHLLTEFSPAAVERYPMRFGPVFDAASASVATELDAHQVSIDPAISEYLQLVLAAPKPLEDLLRAILLTLVHDAREESRITVVAVQSESQLTVTLKNEGFGMPQDKLERYLKEGAGSHETLDAIGAGQFAVRSWGGELQLHSEVGAGMDFELKLTSIL